MKDIPGYPGYKITEDGTVYSYHKGRGWGLGEKSKIVKWKLTPRSIAQVTLSDGITKPKRHQVSRLVALTYIPNPNNHPLVMHLDNNTLNNHYKNLKWGTQSENIKQAYREGRHPGNKGVQPSGVLKLR